MKHISGNWLENEECCEFSYDMLMRAQYGQFLEKKIHDFWADHVELYKNHVKFYARGGKFCTMWVKLDTFKGNSSVQTI